jgi:hypothetical protein
VSNGPVSLGLAHALRSVGRDDDAAARYREAIAQAESARARPWLARGHRAYAELLADQDVDSARAHLASARRHAEGVGMPYELARIVRIEQQIGP